MKHAFISVICLFFVVSAAMAEISGIAPVAQSLQPTFTTSIVKTGNAAAYANGKGDIWLAMISDGTDPDDTASLTLNTNFPYKVSRVPSAGETIYCEAILNYETGGNALCKEGANLPLLEGRVTLLKKDAAGRYIAVANSGWQKFSFGTSASWGKVAISAPNPQLNEYYKATIEIKSSSRPATAAALVSGDSLATFKGKLEPRFGVSVPII